MTYSPLALLARGEARFTGDLPLPPGTLHAMVAVSPQAHARFSGIERSAALAEPGVVAVLTAADIPGINDIGNLFRGEPLLAVEEVHCVGEPYALVVADSADAAWRGARKLSADWQPLPAIFDVRAAYAADQLIQPPRTFALGDVDAAWGDCTTIVSGRVELGSAEHVYMETQCALAIPRDDGGLKIHAATQSPSGVHKAVAAISGLPMHLVDVEVERLGGGFGGKEEQATPWACLAALAALRLRRPVRLQLDRPDDMRLTGKRHPYSADYRLGLDAQGNFLAYEAMLYQNAGCTADLSTAILERSLFHATNAYRLPNVRVTAASCRTNLPSNTAFRGFGAPQAMFVLEAAIRRAARQLGIAPESLQRQNLLRMGDAFPYGMTAADDRATASWDELSSHFDLAGRQQAVADFNANGSQLRKGLAVVPVCFGISFTATLLNQAEALLHVYADGSVSITTGAVDMGQGVQQRIRRVVALTLGVDEARVHVASTSTRSVANVSPTAASTGADLNGEAARQAALRVLAGLRPLAAELLACPPEAVVFADDAATQADGRRIAWPELIVAAYARRLPLSALAHYATPGLHFDPSANQGRPFAYHVMGAALVEATVDVLRGTGRIDRVAVVHDVGRCLDPALDRGQIEGAVVQGIGWMTCEEILHDAQGRLLTDTLASYKIPDLYDAPAIDIRLRQDAGAAGLLGSKAVGEPPLVYGLGAYFALRAAMSAWRPLPDEVQQTPLTAERIFTQLHDL